MNGTYTVGCAVIAADAVGFTLYLRWHFTPPKPGRHSKAGVEARYFEPVEVLDRFSRYCPSENRRTVHARLRLGGIVCTQCRNPCGSGWGR